MFFSCFSRNFFTCVYVFVFQGCAVREAGVLCVGGIKKFEKKSWKSLAVWFVGCTFALAFGNETPPQGGARGREFNDRIT